MKLQVSIFVYIIFLFSCGSSKNIYESRLSFISFDKFEKNPEEIDDNKRLQRAVIYCRDNNVDTLFFPKGEYEFYHTRMWPGQVFLGEEGTVFKKRPMSGKWARMFTTKAKYLGDEDSEMIVFKNITFDGNKDKQGPYKKYQLQQQHILFFDADPRSKGRLRAHVENCTFQNSVADGITTYKNAFLTVKNCKAFNVFRGGVVGGGGNSRIEIDGLETGGEDDMTGIDIEVDGKGSNGKLDIYIVAKNMIIAGDFDIGLHDGSTFIGDNIQVTKPKIHIKGYGSKIKISNSYFNLGDKAKINRIFFPKDIHFDNCKFDYVGNSEGGFSGLNIYFETSYYTEPDHTLKFTNCKFYAKNNKFKNIIALTDIQNSHHVETNRIIIDNCSFEGEFNKVLQARKGGNLEIYNSYMEADKILHINTIRLRSKFILKGDFILLNDKTSVFVEHKHPNKADDISLTGGLIFVENRSKDFQLGDLSLPVLPKRRKVNGNYVKVGNKRVQEFYQFDARGNKYSKKQIRNN